MPEAHKYEQHKMRTTDTLWTYKYIFAFCYGIWFSHRNKATTDPRNWVHGKNQNRWNMNRCNLGCIKQSKEENKKANWLPTKQTMYCMTKPKFYQYPKNYCKSSEQWKESEEQEANKKANWLPTKQTMYCTTKPKFCQYTTKNYCKSSEQWKESEGQEANRKANWLPMKQKWQRIWSGICYMIENTAHITA